MIPSDALEPSGLEPPTSWLQTRGHRLEVSQPQGVTSEAPSVCTYACTNSTFSVHEHIASDPNLSSIIAVWPELPEAIRAGIMAMVKVSQPSPRARKTALASWNCPEFGFSCNCH